jgi:hypothetical protein
MLTGFLEQILIALKRTRELYICNLYNKFASKKYRLTSQGTAEYSRNFIIVFERLRNAG